MAPGWRLLLLAMVVLAAGCRGAHLVAPGSGAAGARTTSATERPGGDGPLVRRYYGTRLIGETGTGHTLTDEQLASVTRARQRRDPSFWQAAVRSPTAAERARSSAEDFTPLNNPFKGAHPGDGVCIDIPRLVDFLGRLFK